MKKQQGVVPLEMESVYWSEKRTNPRTSVSGEASFKAYWISDYCGGDLSLSTFVHAELIDTSINGMRIRTSFPLTKRDLLERVIGFSDSVKEVALVKWVERIDNYYYAGLLCMPEIRKPKDAC